jgi:hypothetical protein
MIVVWRPPNPAYVYRYPLKYTPPGVPRGIPGGPISAPAKRVLDYIGVLAYSGQSGPPRIPLFWGCPGYPVSGVSGAYAVCTHRICAIPGVSDVHICPKYPLYYDSNTVYTRYPSTTQIHPLPWDTPYPGVQNTPISGQNRPILTAKRE